MRQTIKGRKYLFMEHASNIFVARNKIRGLYGAFGKKIFIPSDTSLNQIHKKSEIDIRMKKNSKKGFDIFITAKPHRIPFAHPVIMGYKKRRMS